MAVAGRLRCAVAPVYVGVGANLGDREATIRRAVTLLGEQTGIEVCRMSTLRETAPWGLEDQPRFVNGVVELETTLGPRHLLEALLAVELALGRVRQEERWGPRPIDLDLLVYGDHIVDEPGLTVPHPRLAERRFALEPLVELASDLVIPGQGAAATLLARLGS